MIYHDIIMIHQLLTMIHQLLTASNHQPLIHQLHSLAKHQSTNPYEPPHLTSCPGRCVRVSRFAPSRSSWSRGSRARCSTARPAESQATRGATAGWARSQGAMAHRSWESELSDMEKMTMFEAIHALNQLTSKMEIMTLEN